MGDLDSVRRLSEIFDELGMTTQGFREAMNGLRDAINMPTADQVHEARIDLLKMQEELRDS